MLPTWYNDYKNFIEKSLFNYLDNYLDNSKYGNIINDSETSSEGQQLKISKPLKNFKEIIKYSVKGGKRIRAILALEFYLVLSGKTLDDIDSDSDIIKFCIAIESIHAYSLVHDDLPCMDNDVLRRGEETVWKKYGEYNGVLVGDLLNSFAFEVLSEIKDSNLSKKLTKLLSRSIGFYGMLGGQVEDLYFEENPKQLDIKLLKGLHNKKTGALIKASILGGIILSFSSSCHSGLDQESLKSKNTVNDSETSLEGHVINLELQKKLIKKYNNFGEKLGLAFQIKDDLLDVEGNIEETGKSVGGEEKGFVYFLGLEKSKEKLFSLINDCKKLSKNLSSQKIDFIIDYIGSRKK